MKHRKLRIAWSVAWGIAAVLLVALWATSYSKGFAYDGPLGQKHCLTLYSDYGQFAVSIPAYSGPGPVKPLFIMKPDDTFGIISMMDSGAIDERTFGIPDSATVVCAYWIPTLLVVVISAAPWALRRRFTLRTLLIAVTIATVALGMILYLLRSKPAPSSPSPPTIQPGQSKEGLFGATPPRRSLPLVWG